MKNLLSSLKKISSLFPEDQEVQKSCSFLSKKISEKKEEDYIEVDRVFPLPKEIKTEHDFAIFSDGGCRGNPGPGSWGVVIQSSKGEVIFEASSFDEHTTNNKMELLGAAKGIEFLFELKEELNLEPDQMNIHLYTDSKYVCDGLNQWMAGWKKRNWKKSDGSPVLNQEYWLKLDQLIAKPKSFKAHWVKGHNGHPQNERCDELCNIILDRETS